MNKMFLSCKKAAELIDKRTLFKLSFLENIQLAVHKMMCDACKLYDRQSQFIDMAINNKNNLSEVPGNIDDFKNELKNKLQEPETK